MAKRREFNVFSLSFLDIMSCGFGAVILIFIVINHSTEATSQEINKELMAEVKKLEEQMKDETERLVELKNTVEVVEDETVTAEQVTQELIASIEQLTAQIQSEAESGANQTETIENLKSELKLLEDETASLRGSVDGNELRGTSLRSFVGDGNRQYLTGLNVGGKHILVLIDASASMLHGTIVNAIRLSNMPDEQKRQAAKWQRALRTIDWIAANLPKDADFSLIAFNDKATSLVDRGPWIKTTDKDAMDKALANLAELSPENGTSLINPFAAVRALQPQPDNIFLIVDGLPTLGAQEARRTTISSRDRVNLFRDSLKELPSNIPINVILFPMEGDPLATPYYWILAQQSGGSFLSPSKDWP